MLSEKELLKLLQDIEADSIERTVATKDTDKFGEAVCAIASESDERVLSEKRTSLIKSFDVRPCLGCSLDDLALDLFSLTYRSNAVDENVIKENNRDILHQMSSLRFYDLNKNCATFAGVLLFGKEPLYWLPGAYIQFARFAGNKLSDEPIQQLTFSGDLLNILRELDSFLPLQMKSRPVQASSLREQEKTDYPLIALREFLMNAVMHRTYESNTPIRFYWYSDRIEIQEFLP
jgi:ATP-dependent DNA helicase RecG